MAVVISNTILYLLFFIIYLLFIFLGGFCPQMCPNRVGETDVALYVSWFNWIMKISEAFQTLTNNSEKYILQNEYMHVIMFKTKALWNSLINYDIHNLYSILP